MVCIFSKYTKKNTFLFQVINRHDWDKNTRKFYYKNSFWNQIVAFYKMWNVTVLFVLINATKILKIRIQYFINVRRSFELFFRNNYAPKLKEKF